MHRIKWTLWVPVAIWLALALILELLADPSEARAQTASSTATSTWPVAGNGTVLRVGPGRSYPTPSAALAVAVDGDTIEIDAGVYRCEAGLRFTQNDLSIVGVGNGHAHFDATDCPIPGGKGILNPAGDNYRFVNLEFSGARVGDSNGAGIRFDGGGDVLISRSFFHGNQNGILYTPQRGDVSTRNLVIEHSEFADNGAGDGRSHNVYINGVDSLTFKFNYSHHADVGHLLKSRARHNLILYNRFMDQGDGRSSYHVDVPNGGRAFLIGNIFQQGPLSPNFSIVAFAAETGTAASDNGNHRLYMASNTIVNDHPEGTGIAIFDRRGGFVEARLVNNAFVGIAPERLLRLRAGDGTDLDGRDDARVVLQDNYTGPGDPGFADRANYNYYLDGASALIGAGGEPGTGDGMDLSPVYQYAHPSGGEARPKSGGPPDIGALRYDARAVSAPSLTLSAEASPVAFGTPARLRWSAQHAYHCDAGGSWGGRREPAGSEASPALYSDTVFTLSCHGPAGSVRRELTVRVEDSAAARQLPDFAVTALAGSAVEPLCPRDPLIKGAMDFCRHLDGRSETVYVPSSDKLYLWGGGGRGYYGNEVYAFDLAGRRTERFTEPTDPAATVNFNADYTWAGDKFPGCSAVWDLIGGGSAPASRSPLYGMAYHAGRDRILVSGGQIACASSVFSSDVWELDPHDGGWTPLQREQPAFLGTTARSLAYLPSANLAVIAHNQGVYGYDVDTGRHWSIAARDGALVGAHASAVDSERNLLLYLGRDSVGVLDAGATGAAGMMTAIDYGWTIAGDSAVVQAPLRPGLAYDPRLRRFVAWAGDTAFYFIELDPATRTATFVRKTLRGAPTLAWRDCIYCRANLAYADSTGEYLLFAGVRQPLYSVRMAGDDGASGAGAAVSGWAGPD